MVIIAASLTRHVPGGVLRRGVKLESQGGPGLGCPRQSLWLAVFTAALWGQKISTGPAVGSSVPDVAAEDQVGRTQTLKSIMGPKGAMLVFYRSADW